MSMADWITDESYTYVQTAVMKRAEFLEKGEGVSDRLTKKPFKLTEIALPINSWHEILSLTFE